MYKELALFQRSYYALEKGEADVNLRSWFLHPDRLDTPERAAFYDKDAEHLIRDAETLITELREYRQALAQRYAYLSAAPTVPVIRLERKREYSTKKVTYYLRISRRYVDTGEEVEQTCTKYPGTERSQAIADYKAYVKAHPGIDAEMDIAKSRWER